MNDASDSVKHTAVLAFCVPVYMCADTTNTNGSKSERAMGFTLCEEMGVDRFTFGGGHGGMRVKLQ